MKFKSTQIYSVNSYEQSNNVCQSKKEKKKRIGNGSFRCQTLPNNQRLKRREVIVIIPNIQASTYKF